MYVLKIKTWLGLYHFDPGPYMQPGSKRLIMPTNPKTAPLPVYVLYGSMNSNLNLNPLFTTSYRQY